MKELQILLAVCLLGCCSIKGQDTSRYEIRYITLDQAMLEGDMENSVVKKKKALPAPEGVNGYQIVRLDFFDKKADKVIKSFDVYANSPFENLGYPVIGVNFEGGRIYRVENVHPKDSSLISNKPYWVSDSLVGRCIKCNAAALS